MAKLDWNEYIEKAVQVNAEGAVLVRNQGGLWIKTAKLRFSGVSSLTTTKAVQAREEWSTLQR